MRQAATVASAVLLGASLSACGFLPISRMSGSGARGLAIAPKPEPVDSMFHGCGPAGSQPDYVLNRKKNRVDEGTWVDTPWRVIARLPWPREVGLRFRNQWTEGEQRAVARYEGAPVRVEGFVLGVRLEGREPPNCYSNERDERDYHIWLGEGRGDARKHALVVEITPRIRARHPRWTAERLSMLVEERARVRVSGWLMLDQMHPERVGGNRRTLWEVHPVLAVDVWQADAWVPLDSTEAPRPESGSSPHEPPRQGGPQRPAAHPGAALSAPHIR